MGAVCSNNVPAQTPQEWMPIRKRRLRFATRQVAWIGLDGAKKFDNRSGA